MTEKVVALIKDVIQPSIMAFIGILLSVIGFFSVRTLNQIDSSLTSVSSSVIELKQTVTQAIIEQGSLRRDVDRNTHDIEDLKRRVYMMNNK